MIMLLKIFCFWSRTSAQVTEIGGCTSLFPKRREVFVPRGFNCRRDLMEFHPSSHHLLIGEEAAEQCAGYRARPKELRYVSGKHAVEMLSISKMQE